ncbi:FAD-dependent monooxygenase [Cryptosporangium phraense]|nr:FAD-dependent monooxygenase [Cryptosporangium phraense]
MRVLISGASIAGPTLAYWLVRSGHQVTIVERAPALRPGGNGVDLRAGSLRVVERMGVLPAVREHANDVRGLLFLSRSGRPAARVDLRAIADSMGTDGLEIPRGELARILYDATSDDVEYVFGETIDALAGGDVRFAGGATREFDLVVGADGTHSGVRRLAFGPEEQFVHSLGHCFAVAAAGSTLGTPRWTSLLNWPGRSIAVERPGNREHATVQFGFRYADALAAARLDVDAQKALVERIFGPLAPELTRGALDDPGFYFDALSQVKMPSWSTGRVVLVGDAAHCASPVAGAGAQLAVESAYRLAGELAGDPDGALQRYEAGHRPVVEAAQKGLFLGTVVPRTNAGILARNTLAKLPAIRLLAGLERRLRKPHPPLPDHPFSAAAPAGSPAPGSTSTAASSAN